MVILIILVFLFLFSLLTVFRAPTNHIWYLSILVTEFSWVFILLILLLLLFFASGSPYAKVYYVIGLTAIGFFCLPYLQAFWLARKIETDFKTKFAGEDFVIQSFFIRPWQFLTGMVKGNIHPKAFVYDQKNQLTLDFYAAQFGGIRPCVIVIHGGSWAGGSNKQLPELNSELAKAGYHVASINYRLAPAHNFPAPMEDVQNAICYLQQNANKLFVDSSRFVLLGRSAGGQVALSAAYTLPEPSIKAVIDFYGPTDMIWGYENPTSPLVLDSRKIMEDYLGGTLDAVPDQYHKSSATETVTTKTPPTLMIYAENDPLVSPRHGTRLQVKLKALNIPHYEVYLPWATHGFDYTLNGPGGQVSTWMVKAFLQVVLKEEQK
ncbi:alpha/beta hydrolase [Flavisolibacter sp. BT320]|nr:alpha/beta hydrolase [Flavisolibacter longurius]